MKRPLLFICLLVLVLAMGCAPAQQASWRVAAVFKTATVSVVRAGYPPAPGRPAYSFSPGDIDDVFVLVAFLLSADSQAEALDVQDIVLVADGSDEFRPVGYSDGVNSYVGRFSGTFTPKGADLNVEFDPGGNVDVQRDLLSQPFVFIYVVPREYVNSNHRFQLTIAGSRGVDVAFEGAGPT